MEAVDGYQSISLDLPNPLVLSDRSCAPVGRSSSWTHAIQSRNRRARCTEIHAAAAAAVAVSSYNFGIYCLYFIS